jgi:DNA helicase HerA-like ATPase
MTEPIQVAENDQRELYLLPQMANRRGLITGAAGTGKSVTLQTQAESFSGIGKAFVKSAARSIGSAVGREIIRGVLGSIFGGRKRSQPIFQEGSSR